jgi:hypothetical protein
MNLMNRWIRKDNYRRAYDSLLSLRCMQPSIRNVLMLFTEILENELSALEYT